MCQVLQEILWVFTAGLWEMFMDLWKLIHFLRFFPLGLKFLILSMQGYHDRREYEKYYITPKRNIPKSKKPFPNIN